LQKEIKVMLIKDMDAMSNRFYEGEEKVAMAAHPWRFEVR
jgi:hypothetical protein